MTRTLLLSLWFFSGLSAAGACDGRASEGVAFLQRASCPAGYSIRCGASDCELIGDGDVGPWLVGGVDIRPLNLQGRLESLLGQTFRPDGEAPFHFQVPVSIGSALSSPEVAQLAAAFRVSTAGSGRRPTLEEVAALLGGASGPTGSKP